MRENSSLTSLDLGVWYSQAEARALSEKLAKLNFIGEQGVWQVIHARSENSSLTSLDLGVSCVTVASGLMLVADTCATERSVATWSVEAVRFVGPSLNVFVSLHACGG